MRLPSAIFVITYFYRVGGGMTMAGSPPPGPATVLVEIVEAKQFSFESADLGPSPLTL